jgi:hypothetical protein
MYEVRGWVREGGTQEVQCFGTLCVLGAVVGHEVVLSFAFGVAVARRLDVSALDAVWETRGVIGKSMVGRSMGPVGRLILSLSAGGREIGRDRGKLTVWVGAATGAAGDGRCLSLAVPGSRLQARGKGRFVRRGGALVHTKGLPWSL